MLEIFKSSYFFGKKLFSYMDIKRKLNIIKYNKALQNELDISLINYRIFSGRYIEYESKGKGKEYDYNGILRYEGEYLNGERNGNGKEYYDDGKIKFEGEYLNGKRNGKGKEYDIRGNLIFEGEYLNGKEWKGKRYKDNQIKYELNNGNGIIKEYGWNCDVIFEGECLNGKKNGNGKEYYYKDQI